MKVLIVDDSKAMRMIVQRSLKQAGFDNIQPFEASNGVEALQVIEQHSPDLVLSDLNMPEMKGIDLLKALRAAGRNVPLGFITSESSAEVRQQAAEAGAAFVIVKPFTPAAFEQALKPLLAQVLKFRNLAMSALPTFNDVTSLFTMLFGDRTVCQPSQSPLPGEQAAVIATYGDSTGTIQRVLACDLGFANSAGAALSLIPLGVVNEAIKAGHVPDNILANLHEVLNIAVNLFTDSFGGRLELVDVQRAADVAAALKTVIKAGRAKVIDVSIPRYCSGRVSLISL